MHCARLLVAHNDVAQIIAFKQFNARRKMLSVDFGQTRLARHERAMASRFSFVFRGWRLIIPTER